VRYLVDSDWLIDAFIGVPVAVNLLARLHDEGLAVSIIAYGELNCVCVGETSAEVAPALASPRGARATQSLPRRGAYASLGPGCHSTVPAQASASRIVAQMNGSLASTYRWRSSGKLNCRASSCFSAA